MRDKEISKILLETGLTKRHIKTVSLLYTMHHTEATQKWHKFCLTWVPTSKPKTSLDLEYCISQLRVINRLLFTSFIKLRILILIQKIQEEALLFTGHVLDRRNLL